MKKIFISSTVLLLSILFYSCGSDKPDNLPVTMTANANKSFSIIASAGSESSQTVTFTLDDFAAIEEFKRYVESGEIITSSYIEVTGITGEVELVGVKLSMERDPRKIYNFRNMITENEKFNTITELNFLQNIIDELSSRGSSTIRLEYKANTAITTPVLVELYLNSRFSFD